MTGEGFSAPTSALTSTASKRREAPRSDRMPSRRVSQLETTAVLRPAGAGECMCLLACALLACALLQD